MTISPVVGENLLKRDISKAISDYERFSEEPDLPESAYPMPGCAAPHRVQKKKMDRIDKHLYLLLRVQEQNFQNPVQSAPVPASEMPSPHPEAQTEVTLLGGNLATFKGVRFTGRDAIWMLVIATLALLAWKVLKLSNGIA